MDIIVSNDLVKYERKIEGMGLGLVLFEVFTVPRTTGGKYHLFYENARKPPVDIAINQESSTIEYISFFCQDEKIINSVSTKCESLSKRTIKIVDSDFCQKKYEKSFHQDFDILKEHDNIILLSRENQEKVIAYRLDEDNYILCNQDNEIVGVLMKRIQANEIDVLKKSKVL